MHWIAVVGLCSLALLGAAAVDWLTRLPAAAAPFIGTTGWAAFDSIPIGFRRTAIATSFPVLVAFVLAQLWPITFPWYLVMPPRVRRALAPRVPPFQPGEFVL